MADEVIIADKEGKILFANNAFMLQTGFSMKELKNFSVTKFFEFEPFQKPGSIFNSSVFLLREIGVKIKNKKAILREAAIFQFIYADEMNAGFAIVFQTESEQVAALKKELNKNIFLKVINYRKDAIWFSSDIVNRHTLFITDTIHSLCGWPVEEFYKGGWIFFLSLLPIDDLQLLIDTHGKWLQEKNRVGRMIDHLPYHQFIHLRCRDGNYCRMDVEYNVQKRENGKVHLVFGTYRPIPEKTGLTRDYIRQIDGKTFIDLDFIKNVNKTGKAVTSKLPVLTPREQEIMDFLADGLSSDDIAVKLHLSKHTVNTHRKQIMKKFHGKNLADVVKKYISGRQMEINP